MESSEVEKPVGNGDDVQTLSRNRSFKTKQLVRSQAIRESQSPPRTSSPNIDTSVATDNNRTVYTVDKVNSSQFSDSHDDKVLLKSSSAEEVKPRPVEIQITSNSWDNASDTRQAPRQRWHGNKPDFVSHRTDSLANRTDLLSNGPRVSCVCGGCRPRARADDGRNNTKTDCRCQPRRRTPAKQDSGIVCSDEGPDCSDSENNEPLSPRPKTTESSDAEQSGAVNCRCFDKKERTKPSYLIRTDSDEKNELCEEELVSFVKETLNKNMKDRLTLLKIEKELHALVTDYGRTLIRFPVMSSYGRMLVHRVAALFQLAHHTDLLNKTAVLVTKMGTSGGRIPCTNFREWCTAALPTPTTLQEMQAKSILRRDVHSLDDQHGANNSQGYPGRSKSLEQREKEYQRVRRKIFSDNNGQDQWPWSSSAPIKLLTPEGGRNKLHKVQSLESSTPCQQQRGSVAKSHSFGGYDPQPTRVLSRQGDLASSSWRVSPSSSGYKTLSLRSTDSVTPSPTGGISPEPAPVSVSTSSALELSTASAVSAAAAAAAAVCQQPLVWACTDIASVPTGALIIHPQTGRPLVNTDGSLYQYDPSNPPIFHDVSALMSDDKSDQNCEKRRGRLEKQHSFMENEYDNQLEEYNNNKEYCSENDWSEKPADDTASYLNNKEMNHQQFEQISVEPQNGYEPVEITIPTETEHQPNTEQCVQHEYNNVNYHENQLQEPKEEETVEEEVFPEDVNNCGLYEDTTNQIQATDYSACPTAYTYPNHCQLDTQYYEQVAEEPKVSNQQNIQEPFRIDQSYPYAPQPIQDLSQIQPQYLGLNNQYVTNGYHLSTCAGSCGFDPATGLVNCTRSYPVPYTQNLETGVIPTGYPLTNVLLSQPPPLHHQYTYTPPIQYPLIAPTIPACPTQKPASPPMYLPSTEMYPYPVYGNVYQYPMSVVPQYPVCSQVYPVLDKDRRFDAHKFISKKTSTPGSSRATPVASSTPIADAKPADNKDGVYTQYTQPTTSDTVADDHKVKQLTRMSSVRSDVSASAGSAGSAASAVQHVSQRMSHLGVSDPQAARYPRRNRNPGILGSYPNNFHNRIFNRPNINDETQLNSTARAIVHSIRQMHAKSVFPNDIRHEYPAHPAHAAHPAHNYNHRYNNHRNDNYNHDRRDRHDRHAVSYADQRHNTPQECSVSATGERAGYPRLGRPMAAVPPQVFTPYNVLRQVAPNWCRRSPGPLTAAMPPRRPPLDRGFRRQ